MIPPQTRLHSIDGEQQRFIDENALDESHPYHPYLSHHVEPEFGTLTASDGQTLHYRLIKPFNFDETKRYPVVVGVYGGPCARRVKKQWDPGEAWAQHMAQQGFVHFTLDNRGSSERGKVFEEPIHGLLGEIEIADQKRGVRWLQSQDFVDPERVGIFGWSYGGYMAIMALAKASDVFKAAVSVAPVTDWHLYDTHYTERYLGHPVDNPEGYARSAVFPYLDDLKGDLLVVHGMADDNVLFEHTTKLYAALQKRKIAFETMAYPGSKHSIAEAHNRVHLFQMITRFFQRTLGKPMSTSSDI
jgi:dipeptidyl-peptidase-4